MGDKIAHTSDSAAAKPDPQTGAALFEGSGWMDKFKHGAKTALEHGADLAKKGGHMAAEAGSHVYQKGKEVAQNPTTQKITKEVVNAGSEIVHEQVANGKGVYQAGKNGDVRGVIEKGAPLAAAAALGPEAAIAGLVKKKGVEIVAEKVMKPQETGAPHRKTVPDLEIVDHGHNKK